MKFGGTSVADADCFARVLALIADGRKKRRVAVVVSALGGVTDALIRAATVAARGKKSAWRTAKQEIETRHARIAEKMLTGEEQVRVSARLRGCLAQLEALCTGASLMREVTLRAMDAISSLGEVMSSALLAGVLRSHGIPAEAIDGMEIVVTDDRFGDAAPSFDVTRERTRKRVLPLFEAGILPVITGFRGATQKGICTTLGRGGSDFTATLVGSALDAHEIWIWTDVDGVMTADPGLVKGAKIIDSLSYREAMELSFFGAKVLYYKALQPLLRKKVPVWIKNSFAPSGRGTRIGTRAGAKTKSSGGVKAITSVTKADLITLSGSDTLSFPTISAKTFSALSSQSVPTLMVTQSSADNVLCFAVHHSDLAGVKSMLEKSFELELLHGYMNPIEVMSQAAIVVTIGENMKGIPGIAGRVFGALGGQKINIIAIAQGSSELSISFAVKSSDVKGTVQALHREFRL